MLFYVAHPIDHVVDRDALQFGLDCAFRTLRLHEIAWYDPATPFGSPMADPAACYRINEAALREADALLAVIPPGYASTGTPMEIQRAHDSGKPVAVVGASGSMQLLGMGVRQYDWTGDSRPIEDAIEALKAEAVHRVSQSYQIRWTGPQECAPKRGYPGDAGFDLVVSETTRIHIDQFVDVPCGINVELPYDCWGMITGRSSTLRKRRLLVNMGIIDQGYRGPLFAGVWNMGEEVVVIEKGDRIAQIIPMPLTSMMLLPNHVDELSPAVRGLQAFGSTGT